MWRGHGGAVNAVALWSSGTGSDSSMGSSSLR